MWQRGQQEFVFWEEKFFRKKSSTLFNSVGVYFTQQNKKLENPEFVFLEIKNF
jgi:hypothetical protein